MRLNIIGNGLAHYSSCTAIYCVFSNSGGWGCVDLCRSFINNRAEK